MRSLLLVAIVSIAICISFTSPSHAFFNSDISKAKDFIKADMYPQAIELLNKRIIDEPTDAEAHLFLGQCYAHQGNWSQADQRFNSAVKLEPSMKKDVAARYKELAYRNLQFNNLENAQSSYNKALGYDASVADDEFQKQIGYRYLKKAAEHNGSARETYKQRAAALVGSKQVSEVFPGEKTVTVFEQTYTDKDIVPERGNIIAFTWDNRFRVGDRVEIEGDLPNGASEIAVFRGKNFDPKWITTHQGYLTSKIEQVQESGTYYLLWIDKGKGVTATLKVTRKITPEPNLALLNSLIK